MKHFAIAALGLSASLPAFAGSYNFSGSYEVSSMTIDQNYQFNRTFITTGDYHYTLKRNYYSHTNWKTLDGVTHTIITTERATAMAVYRLLQDWNFNDRIEIYCNGSALASGSSRYYIVTKILDKTGLEPGHCAIESYFYNKR